MFIYLERSVNSTEMNELTLRDIKVNCEEVSKKLGLLKIVKLSLFKLSLNIEYSSIYLQHNSTSDELCVLSSAFIINNIIIIINNINISYYKWLSRRWFGLRKRIIL